MPIDHYRVLGVMPGADEVVVRAAYRALAQRYHPDRFAGDPTEAHRRMAEINGAFAILGDPEKRAEYDAALRDEQTAEFASSETEWQQEQAFSDAMADLDRRWGVACSVFPDLESLKQDLHRISSTLSFAFVMVVLESKNYNKRRELAEQLQRGFFRRYFGENNKVQNFAKDLILARKKEAAKALNDLVIVMGPGVDPMLLIDRVKADFALEKEWGTQKQEKEREHLRLCRSLEKFGWTDTADQLLAMEGYRIRRKRGRWLEPNHYEIHKDGHCIEKIAGNKAYVEWVRATICKNRS